MGGFRHKNQLKPKNNKFLECTLLGSNIGWDTPFVQSLAIIFCHRKCRKTARLEDISLKQLVIQAQYSSTSKVQSTNKSGLRRELQHNREKTKTLHS